MTRETTEAGGDGAGDDASDGLRAFDAETARSLAGRARTLVERLADPDAVEQSSDHDPDVDDLLAAWRDQFPSDDAFERRLDRAGVDDDEVERALRAGRLAADEPVPDWVDRLDRAVTAVVATEPGDHPDHLAPADAGPDGEWPERKFGPVSAAIAGHAGSELPGEVRETLPDEAVGAMAEWLRGRFESRFTRVLYVEFKTFVTAHDRELARADPDEFDDPPTALYEAFLDYLFAGGFVELCERYPVFGRLLATQLRQWEAHLEEFARRLREDRAALADRFGDGDDPGRVVDLRPLADDTHGDGRAVTRVGFESGLAVVYKPRSVDAGVAVADLLDRLNDDLPVSDLRTPAYLARDGYGWTEWVERRDPDEEAAVERFYRRAGCLTCLAYLLEFTDLQYENLVPAGEHPVPVDAETVCHPHVAPADRPTRTSGAALPYGTVLLTRLLPYSVVRSRDDDGDGLAVATAGFLAEQVDGTVEGLERPRVTAANTDVMTVEKQPVRVDRDDSLPAVDGTPRPAGEFAEPFVDAFEATYDAVRDRVADAGPSALGLRDALAGVENRFVYRPTMRYGMTIESLCAASCLRDGARFGVELEALAAPLCDGTVSSDEPWALFDAERRALRRLDPPRFTARADGTEIRFDGEQVGAAVDVSGLERATERLAAAGPADRREQAEYVRSSLEGAPGPDGWRHATRDPDAGEWERTPAADAALRREAATLFERVADAATPGGDGSDHWASVRPPTGPGDALPFTMRPADASIYTGRCGVALLAAALARVEGDDRYRTAAERALLPVRSALAAGRDVPAFSALGGVTGLGGVVYGLTVAGGLLDDDAMLADARCAADLVGGDVIADDSLYDAMAGAAGTVLSLCALHDRTGDPALLERARDCADHLLDARTPADGTGDAPAVAGSPRVWHTLDEHPPLTGYAHGQAGVAYALCRLADATGETAYGDAGLEALAYEDALYDEDAGNWPDLRVHDGVATFPDRWCYGRTGIGLARLGAAAHAGDERVARGVERAVASFPDAGLATVDHVCCGDAGRAGFLLEVERRQGRREGEARELLGGTLARKEASGSYRRLAWTEAVTDPTFFHGVSGIGYQMLRATAPEELPSVLLWE